MADERWGQIWKRAAVLLPLGSLMAAATPAWAEASLQVLPADMTVMGMFLGADWVVKLVIVGLLVASIVTWTVFFAKTLELNKATSVQRQVYAAVDTARTLDEAAENAQAATSPLLAAAITELKLSGDALNDGDGIKERVASRFERIESGVSRRMTRGINVLATIGSTAPFVGLFGTVWGIMNSFIGISEKQTTNLAVVAPGIAEALLATALGLIAAIPAVVIYNHFSRQITAHCALVADTSAAILRLVSRDLSRGVSRDAVSSQAAE